MPFLAKEIEAEGIWESFALLIEALPLPAVASRGSSPKPTPLGLVRGQLQTGSGQRVVNRSESCVPSGPGHLSTNMKLIHFAVQQKLTQHCKATILQ